MLLFSMRCPGYNFPIGALSADGQLEQIQALCAPVSAGAIAYPRPVMDSSPA
jgi:hypothetical protein